MKKQLLPKHIAVLTMISFGSCVGDALLSRGLRQFGAANILSLSSLLAGFESGWIVSGICLLILFMISNVLAFKWMDVTFVLPATATGYLVTPILAHFWLGEHISLTRWLGVGFIVCGIVFGVQGPYRTVPADHDESMSLNVAPNR